MLVLIPVADNRTDSQRIKDLKALCDHLDTLQRQADAICKAASAEIRRAKQAGQRERRARDKKVKQDRRAGR